MTSDRERLNHLFRARHPCVSIVTFEEEQALTLLREIALDHSGDLWVWSFSGGFRDGLVERSLPIPNTEHPAAALTHLAGLTTPIIAVMLDLAGHLNDEKTLRLLRDVLASFSRFGSHLVLVDHKSSLPPIVQSLATLFELSLPGEAELSAIAKEALRSCDLNSRIA